MSSFLAPIHTIVFNKIKLFEGLEHTLMNAYKESYGEDIQVFFENSENQYGEKLESKPIEDLIDTSNIHGWLQNRIDIAEIRQAAFLTMIFNKYGTEAVNLAFDIYSKHGSDCGKDASSKYNINSAPDIYKAINIYLLDGMPCDIVNTITVSDNDKVEWQNTRCLHRDYWKDVGADIKLFYKLRFSWIKAFINASNSEFTYNVNETTINGVPGFIHEIIRKN